MTNDTMRLIHMAANQLKDHILSEDAEYTAYYQDWQSRVWAFQERHKRNPSLVWEMIQLEDAHGLALSVERDFLFFLGLQMGLELGGIDLFGDKVW